MIRTFLFDMGNVLVHFSHDLMCEQIGALCGMTGAQIRESLIQSGLQWEFERGRVSEREFCARLETAVGRPLALDELRHAGSNIFTLNQPMPDILDQLKSRGHRLVLLSNTSISHFEFVRDQFPLLDKFDAFVLSFEVGALKPDDAIFEEALRAIQCAPGECFYTDDIAEYVEAGRRFGLQANLFTDASALVEQLRLFGMELNCAS